MCLFSKEFHKHPTFKTPFFPFGKAVDWTSMSILSIDHQYPFPRCNMRKRSNNDVNTGAVIVLVVIWTVLLCLEPVGEQRGTEASCESCCLIRVGGDTRALYCRGAALLLCCEIKANNTTRRREQGSPSAELCFQARCVDVWCWNRGRKINMEIEEQAWKHFHRTNLLRYATV